MRKDFDYLVSTLEVYERLSAILLATRSKLMTPAAAAVAIRKLNSDAHDSGINLRIDIHEEDMVSAYVEDNGYKNSTAACEGYASSEADGYQSSLC